jgi:hypothetical protein
MLCAGVRMPFANDGDHEASNFMIALGIRTELLRIEDRILTR